MGLYNISLAYPEPQTNRTLRAGYHRHTFGACGGVVQVAHALQTGRGAFHIDEQWL